MKLSHLAFAAALIAAPALAGSPAAAQPAAVQPAPTGSGAGVVKAVDAKAGSVTLHHGPVAALGWPAMTMTFRADPSLLAALKPGQKVTFTVRDGETPEVLAIQPQ